MVFVYIPLSKITFIPDGMVTFFRKLFIIQIRIQKYKIHRGTNSDSNVFI